jgi:cephalosporin-C deacetylase-like acetyl esterase
MRIIILLLLLSLSSLGLCFSSLDSGQFAIEISIETSSENGIYFQGELVEVYAVIKNSSDLNLKGHIHWAIETDEQAPLKHTIIPFSIEPEKEIHSFCPVYEFSDPGFYSYKTEIILDNGQTIERSMNIGYDPEKIKPALTRNPDFDTFWQKASSELGSIDPEFKAILQNQESNLNIDLYFVEMQSLDNIKVTGWLEVPKKRGKYPALLRVPGYTSNMKPTLKYDDMVILSFNPRGHGDSDEGPFSGEELWVRGLDDKETYFYRGAYMDCLRALDFLAEREEVDTDNIAVWGGSQGGGFSFMIAAMDDRVDYCVADIPWLCDWVKYFKTTHWQEIDEWMYQKSQRNWASMLSTLGYFDTMNMAEKIRCPVLMGIGLQDPVCPPATSFATYNYIPGEKEYIVYLRAEHGLGQKHWNHVYDWLRSNFGLAP